MPTATDKTITVRSQTAFTYSSVMATVQSMADAITAAGGSWSVVDNDVVSTNGRQILLKSSDADMANVKVGIFGGVTPHASARRSNGATSDIYICMHTNHAADTFDANFDAGAPLTGSGYLPGISFFNSTSHSVANSIRIIDSGDMLMPMVYDSTDGSDMGIAIAGGIGADESGNLLYGIAGTGTADYNAVAISNNALGLLTGDPAATGVASMASMWLDGAATGVGRLFTTISTTILAAMTNGAGDKITQLQIPIADSGGKTRGYWKQIKIGPNGKCFTTATDQVSGEVTTRIAASLGAAANAESYYLVTTPV